MENWGEEMKKEEQQKVDENRSVVVGGEKYNESFPVLKQINGRISRREKSAAYWNSIKLNLPEAATAAAPEALKPYYLRRKTRLIKSFHIDDNGQLVIEDDHDDQEQSLQQKSSPSSSSSSEEEKNVNEEESLQQKSASSSSEENNNVGCDIHMKSSDDDTIMAQETAAATEEDQVNQEDDKDDDVGCDEMKSEDNVEEYLNDECAEKAGVDLDLSSMQLKLLLQISLTEDGEGESRRSSTQAISSAAPLKQDHSTDQLLDQPQESGDHHEVETETETTPLQERESSTPTLADDDDEKVEADYFFFGSFLIPIPRPKIIPTQTLIAAPDLKMNEQEREAAAFVDEELASEQKSVEENGTSSDNNQTAAALKQVMKVDTQVQLQVQVQKENKEEEEISFGGNHYDHHFPNIDITQLKITKRELKMTKF